MGTEFLQELLRRIQQEERTMLGIMTYEDAVFMANSGKNRADIEKNASDYFDFVNQKSQYQKFTFHWLTSSSMTTHTARSSGGKAIPARLIRACQFQNKPFACAAPKLITHAISQGFDLRNVKLSEVWAGPGTHHAESLWSCDTCKPLLKMLTCPRHPEQSSSDAVRLV